MYCIGGNPWKLFPVRIFYPCTRLTDRLAGLVPSLSSSSQSKGKMSTTENLEQQNSLEGQNSYDVVP
jgi:hypothetical protein